MRPILHAVENLTQKNWRSRKSPTFTNSESNNFYALILPHQGKIDAVESHQLLQPQKPTIFMRQIYQTEGKSTQQKVTHFYNFQTQPFLCVKLTMPSVHLSSWKSPTFTTSESNNFHWSFLPLWKWIDAVESHQLLQPQNPTTFMRWFYHAKRKSMQ